MTYTTSVMHSSHEASVMIASNNTPSVMLASINTQMQSVNNVYADSVR